MSTGGVRRSDYTEVRNQFMQHVETHDLKPGQEENLLVPGVLVENGDEEMRKVAERALNQNGMEPEYRVEMDEGSFYPTDNIFDPESHLNGEYDVHRK